MTLRHFEEEITVKKVRYSVEEASQRLPDMSGEAILSRLKLVGELNELCRFLGSTELSSVARSHVAASQLPDRDQPSLIAEKQ